MKVWRCGSSRWRGLIVGVVLLSLAAGCKKQKGSDTGKTYTSNVPAQQGGASSGSSSSGGSSDAKPLDAPADTTNGKSSPASDNGSSSATRGQVVAEPGAPDAHDPKPPSPKAPASGGHS